MVESASRLALSCFFTSNPFNPKPLQTRIECHPKQQNQPYWQQKVKSSRQVLFYHPPIPFHHSLTSLYLLSPSPPLPSLPQATYSGVPVYECIIKQVAVMRRRSDNWLNATQILKVVGLDKPQRTRILERDIQKGVHEKVQGGYGKYQGQ